MSKQAVLGVDVGGTKTLCLLVNSRRQIVAEAKFKTAGREGCDVFSRNLLKELKGLAERAHTQRLELVGIGVGCAGTVDRKHGIIKTSPNLLCLEGFPVRRFLQVLSEVGAGLREYLVPEVAEVFKLRRAQLGGHAVALGAADIAFRQEISTD